MKVCVIIPVFNEEDFIEKSIKSIINQTVKPEKVIYVNDSSTDNTKQLINKISCDCDWIKIIDHKSKKEHIPGSKVVKAFNYGLKSLNIPYDIICKFDGDIVLPENYIEKIRNIFLSDSEIGLASGNLYILAKEKWVYEKVAAKSHVRGPIKAYRRKCFEEIKGLKSCIGWDTVDVLLAQKKGWKIFTDKNLIVKHLKPTGKKYSLESKLYQGEALYTMRFGIVLSILSIIKSSFNTKDPLKILFASCGFLISFLKQKPFIVDKEEGKYIRNFRWNVIYSKYLKF